MTSPLPELFLDSSVLINFLAVDRLDILCRLAERRWITGHVLAEIDISHQPHRRLRLQQALAGSQLERVEVVEPAAIELFRLLVESKRLGAGESSAIAGATVRRIPLAIDDRAARNAAIRETPQLVLLSSADLILRAIRAEILALEDADALKLSWERDYRFRLPFRSFGELLAQR